MNAITVARFWSKVNKSGDCWVWTASKRCKGYGAFVYPSESGDIIQGRAHRFSWELHRGPIPKGMCVLHKCDVAACVNPDHLWLGSKAENNADMCAKGRHVRGGTHCGTGKYKRGESHWNHKLTPEIAFAIRAEYELGTISLSRLGAKYGICTVTVHRIIRGKHWTIRKEGESC